MKPSDALRLRRRDIRRVVEAHRGRNARVFGSVLRGDDAEGNELDAIERIERYTEDMTEPAFLRNELVQDAVIPF